MIHQVRELHVRREARARYGVDAALFTLSGNAILPNLRAVRALAASMTAARRAAGAPDPVGRRPARSTRWASSTRSSTRSWRSIASTRIPRRSTTPWTTSTRSSARRPSTRRSCASSTDFPPLAVHRGELTPEAYLAGETGGNAQPRGRARGAGRLLARERQPGVRPVPRAVRRRATSPPRPPTAAVIAELGRFFAGPGPFGPDRQDLVTMLRAPGPGRARTRSPGSSAGSGPAGAASWRPTWASGSAPSSIGW